MPNYRQFTIRCACGALTSKAYARQHAGKCKACTTGVEPTKGLPLCPDCGEHRLTAYQVRHRYHCDVCTRETDPIGAYNEMMGHYDGPGY